MVNTVGSSADAQNGDTKQVDAAELSQDWNPALAVAKLSAPQRNALEATLIKQDAQQTIGLRR